MLCLLIVGAFEISNPVCYVWEILSQEKSSTFVWYSNNREMGNACNVSENEFSSPTSSEDKDGYLGSTSPHKLRRNRSGTFSFKGAQRQIQSRVRFDPNPLFRFLLSKSLFSVFRSWTQLSLGQLDIRRSTEWEDRTTWVSFSRIITHTIPGSNILIIIAWS